MQRSATPGSPPQQRAFLRLARLVGLIDATALVAVPNEYTKEVLEQRLRAQVIDALGAQLEREVLLAVTVDPSLATDQPRARSSTRRRSRRLTDPERGRRATRRSEARPAAVSVEPAPDGRAGRRARRRAPSTGRAATSRAAPEPVEAAHLNPKYVFETFVIGSSNRFAHAAAVAVAEAPAKAYNPLFVYGESGLGKTHLLHAIGHYARNLYPGIRVRYVNSEEFTNDFINSIRDDKAQAFQRRHRDVDILLIDDIQFLQGKVQTQEEFFHTFNTLHNANKQVVITSDLPPEAAVRLRGADAQPVRVGPDHRRPAARPRDPHRDPAQEGDPGADDRAGRRHGVHRQPDLDQHPRARGRADPGHRVRQPQPAGGRPRRWPRSC